MPASKDADPAPLPHNEPSPKAKGPWTRFLVQYAADSHELTRQDAPDGKIHLSVAFITAVYDAQGNRVNSASNTVNASVTPADYEKLRKTGIQYRQQISIPAKGAYTVRTVVNDLLGPHVGAVEIPLAAVQNLAPLNLPPPAQ